MKELARWITDRESLLAPVVALLLIFPTRSRVLTSAGLIALAAVWLVRWRVQGYPMHPTPFNLAMLSLLVTIPGAVWASTVPDLTAVALAYLLAGIILILAVAHWARTAARAWLIWGELLAVGLTLAVLAPLSMRFSPSLFYLPARYTRWTGWLPETIHANVMAGALTILWPISLVGVRFQTSNITHYPSRITRYMLPLIAIPSAFLLLVTLVLTQSRGAYLAIAVGLLVILGLRRPKVAMLVIPTVLIVALLGGSLVGWHVVADQLTVSDVTSGLDGRIEIWSRSIYAIQDFPFTGLGLGTFERVAAVLYPLFLNPAGTVPHAHNLFLQVAVDLGLPGLIAYLALLGLTFTLGLSAHRTFQQRDQSALASLCAGCIAGLTGMCVHGLVDAATWGLKLAFIPWAVMGLVVALHKLSEEEESPEDQAPK